MRRFFLFLAFLLFLLSSCSPKTAQSESVRTDTPLAAAASTATASPTAQPEGEDAPLIAALNEVIGQVFARASGSETFSEVGNGFILYPRGQVETKSNSKVRLDLSDNTLIRLGENSLFTLDYPKQEPNGLLTRLQLEVGKIWIILNGGALEVETSSGVAAVRGSYMYVEYDPDSGEMRITCLEGNCSLSNAQGTVEITAGQTAVILNANLAPVVGFMSEEDIQDWLDNNPEAQIIVPYLTEIALTLTPQVTATFTPLPTATASGYNPTSPPPIVVKPAPTVLIDTISPASSVVGEAVNYSVSVLPTSGGLIPSGSVEVKAAVGLICTVTLNAGGTGSCNGSLPTAGTHNIQAFYTGDSHYGTNYSSSQAYTVTAASTTTSLDSYNPASAVVGETVTVHYTVAPNAPGSGIPGGTVNVSGGGASCSATASAGQCDLQFPAAGTFGVTVNFLGSSNYTASSSASVDYDVSQANTTTTIQSQNPNPSLADTPVTFQATVDPVAPGSGTPFGSVTFTDTIIASDTCTASAAPWTCSISFTGVGTRLVTASYSGDANFNGSVSPSSSQLVAPSNDSYFYNHVGPDGISISACLQNYSVDVIDLDGLTSVDLEYSINDSGFSTPTTAGSLSLSGINSWGISASIPASAGDTVYWRFKALDNLSNSNTDTVNFSYTSINCP